MIPFALITAFALIFTYATIFPKTKGVLRPLEVPSKKASPLGRPE